MQAREALEDGSVLARFKLLTIAGDPAKMKIPWIRRMSKGDVKGYIFANETVIEIGDTAYVVDRFVAWPTKARDKIFVAPTDIIMPGFVTSEVHRVFKGEIKPTGMELAVALAALRAVGLLDFDAMKTKNGEYDGTRALTEDGGVVRVVWEGSEVYVVKYAQEETLEQG